MVTYPDDLDDFEDVEWVKVFIPFACTSFALVYGWLTIVYDFGVVQYTRLNKYLITFIWLVLSICVGFSWAFSGDSVPSLVFFIIIMVCILLWVPLFNTDPLYSYYLIYVVATCASLIWADGPRKSALCIIPFLTWLALTASFNYFVVLEQARLIKSDPQM